MRGANHSLATHWSMARKALRNVANAAAPHAMPNRKVLVPVRADGGGGGGRPEGGGGRPEALLASRTEPPELESAIRTVPSSRQASSREPVLSSASLPTALNGEISGDCSVPIAHKSDPPPSFTPDLVGSPAIVVT